MISIHAPARGASLVLFGIRWSDADFNSRPCERGFSEVRAIDNLDDMISIHAPARGASVYEAYCDSAEQFQFTPLREGLHQLPRAGSGYTLFQFTPLREGLREKIENISCPN